VIHEDDFILTKKNFSKLIEKMVMEKRMAYIDAILTLCNERGIDPTDASKLLTNMMRDRVEAEAVRENKLKIKYNTLPI
jgi:hypothetical protein